MVKRLIHGIRLHCRTLYLYVLSDCTVSLSVECGAGWIFDNNENVCYQVVLNSPKTWTGARADCRQKGSDLLSISGRREQNFIQGNGAFIVV